MGTANQIEQELICYISEHQIRNTHSHHLPEQTMRDFNLDKLINNAYLQWQDITPGNNSGKQNCIPGKKCDYKSYFNLASKSNWGVVWNTRSDYGKKLGTLFQIKSCKAHQESHLLYGS